MQASFFNHIKERLPAHLSLVDEIADLLNISTDSAYRRIRAEKALSFDEIQKLAIHFNVSLDQFLHLKSNTLTFAANYISRDSYDFKNYLEGIVTQLTHFTKAQKAELYNLNKDIPIFHHFMFPELAAFKCYFWCRYNLNYSQFNKGQFLIDDFIKLFESTGRKISDLYLQIPSTEVWNLDCINTTIRQIDYYRETKIFKSHEDILTVYNCLEKLIGHIEHQVDAGKKFPFQKPQEALSKYTVFINEFILGDNTFMVETDGERMVFLNHNVINYIQTHDRQFVAYTFQTLHTLLKKSTLISEIGEKDRQLFFDKLRERIGEKKKLV